MVDNFERLYSGVSSIYKNIQKLKKSEMDIFGLSGKYVMPFYYLLKHPEGLTSAQLCRLCNSDKAGVSRTLAQMEQEGLVIFEGSSEKKRYRTLIFLTSSGMEKAKKVENIILHITLESGQSISAEEREIFYRILNLIDDNLSKICESQEEK